MIKTFSYAAHNATTSLVPYSFERRELREHDILIEILYSGVCHSDIHATRNEWGGAIYPMVPGHEIVGTVKQIGSQVTKFKIGDIAGVGVLVDSCRKCSSCHDGFEQYCENNRSFTYGSYEQDGKTVTQGGYANNIVVDESFSLQISPKLPLANVAPLLCAGITTYSPLKYWNVQKGQNVAVIGLGGLGHMAVKFAKAMGANVTLFTTSKSKKEDALKLGVDEVVISTDLEIMNDYPCKLDLIISTISNKYDISVYLSKLRRDGVLVVVGLPGEDIALNFRDIVTNRRKICGSAFGGIAETQEMLDFCAKHDITADIELISIKDINKAYERVLKSDVKYRFVIDMASINN